MKERLCSEHRETLQAVITNYQQASETLFRELLEGESSLCDFARELGASAAGAAISARKSVERKDDTIDIKKRLMVQAIVQFGIAAFARRIQAENVQLVTAQQAAQN